MFFRELNPARARFVKARRNRGSVLRPQPRQQLGEPLRTL
jgi:hypothetical protein